MIKSIGFDTVSFTEPNSDLTPSVLPVESLSEANNYRALDGKLIAFNGSKPLYTPTASINVGKGMYVKTAVGQEFYILLGNEKVMAYDGSTWYDITSTQMALTPLNLSEELSWTTTMLGSIPIINNPLSTVEYWSPQQTSTKFQPLKFDPTHTWQQLNYAAKVIRSHKNFLFAMNLTEGSIEYPDSYRWSHPADINGLPPSWDETSLSYIAGKASLGSNMGRIMDGCSLRDSFVLYSEKGISVLDYNGGEFVWSARELTTTYGLVATNCVLEANGVNIFLTDGDIVINDGNNIQSILTRKLQRKFASALSTTNVANCFFVHNKAKKEVWAFIVEEGYTYPSKIYIFNWLTGTISIRDCDGTFTCGFFATQVSNLDTWASKNTGWDIENGVWNDNANSAFGGVVFGVRQSDSVIHTLEENSGHYDTYLERTNFPMEGLNSVDTVVDVFPKLECAGPVRITFGSQNRFNGSISWKGSRIYDPNTQRKLALRTTGAYHCWRIESVDAYQFKYSGMMFEYVPSGRR